MHFHNGVVIGYGKGIEILAGDRFRGGAGAAAVVSAFPVAEILVVAIVLVNGDCDGWPANTGISHFLPSALLEQVEVFPATLTETDGFSP
jgi:hypothetical protein